MIRVFIADDHPIVREGLRRLLDAQPDMEVLGEAEDGHGVLAALRSEAPEVLLLDVTMPGPGFLEILSRVRRGYPDVQVLVLSVHPEDQMAVRSLQEGAAGYLCKDSATEELVGAVRHLAGGQRYVSQTLAELLATRLVDGEGPIHASLSRREFQVLRMGASGRAPRQIAEELSLSPKTVSTYRRRILEKLQLENHAEVIRYAIQNGLVD